MTRVFMASFMLLALLGCGGGGGGGSTPGNFTVNMAFPTYNAGSENELARARSAWVFVISETNQERQWAGIFNRSGDGAETVTKHMAVEPSASYRIDVLAYSGPSGTGDVVGQKTFTGEPQNADVTITSL